MRDGRRPFSRATALLGRELSRRGRRSSFKVAHTATTEAEALVLARAGRGHPGFAARGGPLLFCGIPRGTAARQQELSIQGTPDRAGCMLHGPISPISLGL